MELEGVIIDGAIPRSEYERCRTLVEYAEAAMKARDPLDLDNHDLLRTRLDDHQREVLRVNADFEWWNELEDNIIEVINDVLPDHLTCTLGEPNPGDVVVSERTEDY